MTQVPEAIFTREEGARQGGTGKNSPAMALCIAAYQQAINASSFALASVKAEGVTRVLAKPFDLDELLAAIGELAVPTL